MFEPRFIEHRGVRILRLEYADLSPAELVAAADQVRQLVATQPPRSVRTLTILKSKLTNEGAEALKRAALANRPYIIAGAVVAGSFWRVIAADLRARGREDLTTFDDEASALEWLSGT
ncbi:MAG TPA: hypothetical protein VEM76_15225 [Anaeromyxobacteraceae bacterium]|nr:hypothetical protein [Anaeromyxobacteraceae bacterium]